ncbi:hypothetical protein [Verrucosispora sp. ts21]|uniref:hypothetical protein n=1 Tax=Verrucosispora sp. ts21 TaxID=2069341 RepID=UPI0011AEF385|nr:hypothetical protein [Verrucosispora sp. ts21]
MWHQQRRIHRLLRQLEFDLPMPLTVQALVATLETVRHRRIQFVAMSVEQTGPCGLWVATAEADYVLYGRDSPPILRLQTILHELMHIALRHAGHAALSRGTGQVGGFGDTPTEVVLARSTSAFGEQQEHDAELLATYLGARLDGGDQVGAFEDLADATAAVMYRIAAVLAE